MLNRLLTFFALFSSLFINHEFYGQCNITPELSGSAVYDELGNNNDYILVCFQGGTTGPLLVQNGISSTFFSFFNSYTIDWGDNSPSYFTTTDDFSNPPAAHIYNAGNYQLTFSAIGGSCTVVHVYDVYVGSPSVGLNVPGGTEGCSEVTVNFPVTSTANNSPNTTYSVTFSDGSLEQTYNQPPPDTVSHTFNQSSCGETFVSAQNTLENSFGVIITATNVCGQSQATVAPVRISTPPDADFSTSLETICSPGTIIFDDISDPGTTAAQSGCTSNAKFYWTISPSLGWSIVSGSLGNNFGLPGEFFSNWSSGSDQLSVQFNSPGVYDVVINYQNGCGPSTHTETICVIEPPVCDFDVSTNSGCGPLTVITDNNTVAPDCDGNELNLIYAWQVTVPTGGSYNLTSGTLSSANPTFNLTNTTSTTLVYTLSLTVTPINPQTGQAMSDCSSTCNEIITVYPAPVISTQPTPNQSICVGGIPSLLSVAYQYGVGAPAYQWYSNTVNSNLNGTMIAGANTPNYQPPVLNTVGNTYYYAVITLGGSCGTIESNPACVSVIADPTISTQPISNQSICSGGTPITLTMSYANGTGSPIYQWYSNTINSTVGGTQIAGADDANFTPVVSNIPGTYYFYGTVDLDGSGCALATTAIAAIEVIADPVVTINPQVYTFCQNSTATTINSTVNGGSGSNAYQWYQTTTAVNNGGTALLGQTSSSFTPSTNIVGTQYYYLQVNQNTTGCSSASQPITVNILPAPSFVTQPQPSTVCVDGVPNILSATYNNGNGIPIYQWYSTPNSDGSGGVAITGATLSNYLPPTDVIGTIYYYLDIEFGVGGCSSISSNIAAVTVVADPILFIEPNSSQELCVGGEITAPLSVTASGGTGAYIYQWYSNSSASNANGTLINAATNSNYLPPAFASAGNYYYYATVSTIESGCDESSSEILSIVVVNDPVVSLQPILAQEICQNAPTTPISASVSGGSGIASFTWYSTPINTAIDGTQVSTANPFNPPSTTVGELYYYAVINQSGEGCSVVTATSEVTVTPAASFSLQPTGSTVCLNGTASDLSVEIVNGLGMPNYQWYSSPNSNGIPATSILGATDNLFTPPTSTIGNLYYFVEVIFTGGNCSDITSNTALVSVVADPQISVQPQTPQLICEGNSLSSGLAFTVTGGTGNLTYQWYSNDVSSIIGGTEINDATSENYNPPVFDTPGTYYFYASVNASGVGCESTNTAVVAITVNSRASVLIDGPYSTCGTSAIPISVDSSEPGFWSALPASGVFATSSDENTSFTPNSGLAQEIILTWTTVDPDGSGPCLAENASTTLNVYQPATASLPANANLCGNEILDLSVTTNAQGVWSSSGAGSFNPVNNPISTYSPSITDTANSPIDITWTTNDPDGAGPCESVSVTQTVHVTVPPEVNAGFDQTLCLNSGTVTLVGTPIGGAWDGSNVSSSGDFNPSIIGVFDLTYTFTDLNGCESFDEVVINVNQAAIADANGPYFVCGLTPIALNATTNGVGNWNGGSGSFDNPNSPNTTYTPSVIEMGTTLELSWTTFDPDGLGPCAGAIDVAQLTVNIPATVDSGGPYTICSSDVANIEVTSSPATGIWNGGTGTFSDSNAALTTYTPSSNESGTTVLLNWTTSDPDGNGPCLPQSSEIAINVLAAAIALSNGPYTVCGAESVALDATTNGNGSWNGGTGVFMNATDPNTTYQPSADEVGEIIELTWETFDPDNSGPCTGAIDAALLTISEPASVVPGGPYTICSSDIADIEVTSDPNIGNWTGGSGIYGSVSNSTTTYTPGDTEGGSLVELTWTTIDPDGTGPCPVANAVVTVNILEAAIADANGPYAICGVQPVELSATANGAGSWFGGAGNFDDSTNPLTNYTPASAEVGQTIQMTWETFDPDGDGPCSGAVDVVDLFISTPAIAIPGGPYTICSNGTANVEILSSPESGAWIGGYGTFSDSTAPITIYTPSISEGGTTVSLEWQTIDPDDSGPCPSATATVQLNVLEQATATIAGPFEVCANGEVVINSVSNGPGEWTLNPSSLGSLENYSSNSTTFSPIVDDLHSNHEVEIAWTTFDPDGEGPCSSFTATDIISIHALPEVSLQANYTIDCGDIIGASVSGGSGVGYSYQWTPMIGLIDPTSISTPVNASGDYQIEITDENGCSGTAVTSVLINALDQMAQADDAELCLLESIELTGAATLGLSPYTYSWSPASNLNPSSGLGPSVNFQYSEDLTQDSIFTYVVNITDALGCSDNEIVFVTVHPLPVVNAGDDMQYCSDEPAFELGGYSPVESTGLSSSWTPGSTADPSSLVIGDNIFTYAFTDLNGCTNSDSRNVFIHEVPVASFEFPSSACEDVAIQFVNQSTCSSCGVLQYQWFFGDAIGESNVESPLFAFQDTGYFNITLVVLSEFGCTDTMSDTIHILALPETSFQLSENFGCGPIDIGIENTTIGSEITYSWNIDSYGMTSDFEPGVVTFPAAPCDSIFYFVQLVAENICGITSYSDNILVYSPPQPQFNISADTICSSVPISLYNSTTCGWETYYTWNLGEGTIFDSQELILDHIYYAFDSFSEYLVTLTAANECGSVDYEQSITVVPNSIDAFFNSDPINGCEPLPVGFDQEMNGVTYFAWDFGDGSTSLEMDPIHIFQEEGSYQITFIAGNFCGAQDTAFQVVNVLPSPEFDFTSTEQYLCVGESTMFEALGDPIYGYQWDFGDGNGSTLINPTHVYEDTGVYAVSLTALSLTNGCPSTVTNNVEVITTPSADIVADTLAGCPPFLVNFSNNSSDAITYFWNLDDGSSYVGDSLQYTFGTSGIFSVEVVAINSNSCADTAVVSITVYPSPIAKFSYIAQDNDVDLDVDFLNESVNAIAYEWDFGDGEFSYSVNANNDYDKFGDCIYKPVLKAYNNFGCTDVYSDAIEIPFQLRVYAPNSFTPNNDGLNDVFTIITTDADPLLTKLQIFDRWGNLIHEYGGLNPFWDGYVNNQLATNDSYIWILKTRMKCGYDFKEYKGHVIVVR